MTKVIARRSVARFSAPAVVLALAGAACGQSWTEQGPWITRNGQTEAIPNNPVVGGINRILSFDGNADSLLIGSVNGGIWRATNINAAAGPTWSLTTSGMPSQSIGAMAFNRLNQNDVYAGFGRVSNYSNQGGRLSGIIRSSDAGQTWAPVVAPALTNVNISGMVARGNGIVVVTGSNLDQPTATTRGLFRPSSFLNPGPVGTPAGTMINLAAAGAGINSNLPAGDYTDIANASGNTSAMYCAVVNTGVNNPAGGPFAGQTRDGVYRSNDAGDTWSQVLPAPAAPAGQSLVGIKLAGRDNAFAGPTTAFAGFVYGTLNGSSTSSSTLTDIRRTANDGGSWQRILGGAAGAPADGNGFHIGGQGVPNTSFIADPANPNVVYVGGDRQTTPFGAGNPLGATDYTGRLFRGTYDPTAATSTWDSITHTGDTPNGGTSNNSAPHADSRGFAFVPLPGGAAGFNLIEADDGGIYRRTQPTANTGAWQSLIGTNLGVNESHSVAYDRLSGILIAGTQDTGTTQQSATGSKTWDQAPLLGGGTLRGDGGVVAVDPTFVQPDDPAHPMPVAARQRSIRYGSFYQLGGFQRSYYRADNTLDRIEAVGLAKDTGGVFQAVDAANNAVDGGTFYTTYALNRLDSGSGLMVIGGTGKAFRSFDYGDNLITLGGIRANATISAIAYGGKKNGVDDVGINYVGSGGKGSGGANDMYRRQAADVNFVRLTNYTGAGVEDIVMNSTDWAKVYITDRTSIYQTTNGDAAAAAVAFNAILNPGLPSDFACDALEFAFDSGSGLLIAGGLGGVYALRESNIFTAVGPVDPSKNWFVLGFNIPNVLVTDLSYDPVSNTLAAATLGRGVWTLQVPAPGAGILFGALGLVASRRKRR